MTRVVLSLFLLMLPLVAHGGVSYVEAAAASEPQVTSTCHWTGSGTSLTESYDVGTNGAIGTCADPAENDLVLIWIGLDPGDSTNNEVDLETSGACTDAANSANYAPFAAGTRTTTNTMGVVSYTMGATAATTFTCSWTNSAAYRVLVVVLDSGTPNTTNTRANMLSGFGGGDPQALLSGPDANPTLFASLTINNKTITDCPSDYATHVSGTTGDPGMDINGGTDEMAVCLVYGGSDGDPATFTTSGSDGHVGHTAEVN